MKHGIVSLWKVSLLLGLSGCGLKAGSPSLLTSATGANGAQGVSLTADPQALALLKTNCASCHGGAAGVSDITDLNALVAKGWLVPGAPDRSLLLTAIETNRMPPAVPMASADKLYLRDWISQPVAAPLPSPTPVSPVPAPTPVSPVDGTLAGQAAAVFKTHCVSCHGAGFMDTLQPSGFVVPGNPSGSPAYDAIVKGRMPKAYTLAASDAAAVGAWIQSLGAAPPPAPPAATYANVQSLVIGPLCVSCHGPSVARGGVRLDSYTQLKKYVKAGSASSSKLYTIIDSGEMPPSGSPTSAQMQILTDWIQGGALNN